MTAVLPDNHPLRIELNNEVHARPPEPLSAPVKISYLALCNKKPFSEEDIEPVRKLIADYNVTPPEPGVNHFNAELGELRMKWERHTEFTRYVFISNMNSSDAFAQPVIKRLPEEWLSSLPGDVMVATHISIIQGDKPPNSISAISDEVFAGNVLVGSAIADGAATALTDFRIYEDGFSRLWLANHSMNAWQTGRMVQRLLEVDSYRMMALLALPLAKDLAPHISDSEQELVDVTAALSQPGQSDEAALLQRLTHLQAEIESQHSKSHYRFGAAAAYYALVERRIHELREQRIRGVQTFQEFTQRRLVPAMDTCRTVAERQDSLSTRVARATQLLSTRVDMAMREQNQNVLESMDRRAKLQLRLQSTVEGLSIAAITYYIVGLIGYIAKGGKAFGIDVNSSAITAISIPIVIFTVAFGIRRVRRKIELKESA